MARASRALTPSLTSKSWEIGMKRPAEPDDFLAPRRRSGPSRAADAAGQQGASAVSATEQVQELKQRLSEATSWAAHCRGEAQAAADKLISQPSVELVQARDQAKALAEVADLEVERVERALREAEEQARVGQDRRAAGWSP